MEEKRATIHERLNTIQKQLKVPKNQKNTFGGYNYRNLEDILEAVKPLLDGCYIHLEDEVVLIGDRYYVKAYATITDGTDSIYTTAYAREALDKKGMDDSQITGAASSYARKYALNGLFAIDDTKDADHESQSTKPKPSSVTPAKPTAYKITQNQINLITNLLEQKGFNESQLLKKYKVKEAGQLTSTQASTIITNLRKLPDKDVVQVDPDEVDAGIEKMKEEEKNEKNS